MGLLSGTQPKNIGIHNGKLQAVDMKPWNAVSSFAESGYHKIAPLATGNDPKASFERLKALVASDPAVTIAKSEKNYLYAQYKTKVLGFIDDVEFLLNPKAKVIHLRSASRLGRKDFGVNRKRIENLRAQLQIKT